MSKLCSICGYECADATAFCPTCGTPFPEHADSGQEQLNATKESPQIQSNIPAETPSASSPEPQTTVLSQTTASEQMNAQTAAPQTSAPVQSQTAAPQTSAPVQSQMATPQAGAPFQPQMANSVQMGAYIQNPAMTGAMTQADTPSKKSHKTLWIILGIVGGVILLLVLFALILLFLFHAIMSVDGQVSSSPFTSGIESADHHEYYYPDYDHADFHSEAFTDTTTEEPATEVPATEEPAVSSNPEDDPAAFRPEDLTMISIESDAAIPPITLTFEMNQGYLIAPDGSSLQMGSGTFATPAGFEEKPAALGRGITTGHSMEELITAYGIDTTNAIWQLSSDGTTEYFYYSTDVKPELTDYTALIFIWYRTGETWNRMTPQAVFNYWQNGILPECDELIMYLVETNSNYNVNSIMVTHGDVNYFQEFILNWNNLYELFHDETDESSPA